MDSINDYSAEILRLLEPVCQSALKIDHHRHLIYYNSLILHYWGGASQTPILGQFPKRSTRLIKG